MFFVLALLEAELINRAFQHTDLLATIVIAYFEQIVKFALLLLFCHVVTAN